MQREQTAADFWMKVRKTDTCWIWTASHVRGYGRARYQRREFKAHRLAWILTNGPIPDGFLVCHHCDNPSCVKPVHLFLGTSADNRHDQDSKLRHNRGENVNTNKLTSAQVIEIRRRFAEGETNRSELARQYGVSNPLVGLIVRGKCWRHLNQPQTIPS